MNAYFFAGFAMWIQFGETSGLYGQKTNQPRSWDSCASMVLIGGTPDEAQARFETWLGGIPEGETGLRKEIGIVVGAQFVDQLLAEPGPAPLDWRQLCQPTEEAAETSPEEVFEQGYWVDVEQVVPPGPPSADIATLQRELPEDIRSGLNWSAEKQSYYILSVLSPPGPPPEPSEEELLDDNAGFERKKLAEQQATYPELADKETAAIIQARNSVVAAWLWRRFAADTPLANYAIRIDPWCGAMEIEPAV